MSKPIGPAAPAPATLFGWMRAAIHHAKQLEDWTCSTCRRRNDRREERCSRCGGPR